MRKITWFIVLLLFMTSLSVPGVHAADKEPEYVLTLNLPIPPIHNRWHYAMKDWCEEIYKRSNGRLKIVPYFSEALSKESEAYESVKYGVADIAEFSYDVAIGHFPFHERVFTTVSMGRSMENPTDWLVEIENAFPETMKELEGVKLLFSHAQTMGMLIGSSEPIRSLDELRNKKVNVIGDYQVANKLRGLGVSVVSVPMADVYMSLQQGVIDATSCDFDLLVSRRLGDIVKHVTMLQTTCFVFCVVMNENAYNSLPEDLKAVIDSVSGEYGRNIFKQFWNTLPYNALETWITKMGGQLHILTPKEYEEVDAAMIPVVDEWKNIVEKSGYSGNDMVDRIRQIGEKYSCPWENSRAVQFMKQLQANK